MSTVVWQSLSPQEQQWLQEAVNESVEHQKILWKESSDEALREVQKAGVKVLYPDKTPFQQEVQEMHASYKGTTIYDLIREIQNVK